MNLFKSGGVIVLIVLAFIVWSATFVVDEREKALVLRFGEINRIVEKPGLYFKIPIADDGRADRGSHDHVDQRRQERAGGRRPALSGRCRHHGADRQCAEIPRNGSAPIWRGRATVSRPVSTRRCARPTASAHSKSALSKDRAVMMREIRDQVRGEASNLGIEIVDVRIVRTDLMDEVLKNTYERMSSERLAEAKDLRARGEARKTEMIAQADRSYTERIADARRQSGDHPRRRRRRAQPDLRRSLPAGSGVLLPSTARCRPMRRAWRRSGTTLVLKPDSEFFKYFGTEKQDAAPAAAAMTEFVTALGLVLVIEGLLYAFVPGHLKRMMAMMQNIPDETLRMGGVVGDGGRRRPRLAGAQPCLAVHEIVIAIGLRNGGAMLLISCARPDGDVRCGMNGRLLGTSRRRRWRRPWSSGSSRSSRRSATCAVRSASTAAVGCRSGREALAGGRRHRDDPEGRQAAAPICRCRTFRPMCRSATCSRISCKRQRPGQGRPEPRTVNSLGSGFVIDADGRDRHQQSRDRAGRRHQVNFTDGTHLKAELVGRDPKTDIAVLRVKPDKPLAGGHLRQFRRAPGRRLGARHRQSVRPRRLGVARHRLGAQPRHQCRSL